MSRGLLPTSNSFQLRAALRPVEMTFPMSRGLLLVRHDLLFFILSTSVEMTFPMSRGLLPERVTGTAADPPAVEMTFPMSRGLLQRKSNCDDDDTSERGNDLPDE